MSRNIKWDAVTIAGKDADVFVPSTPVRHALLFLHPLGDESLAHPSANFTDDLNTAGVACCCPYASRTWWSDRSYVPFDEVLTAEAFLLKSVVPWMRENWTSSIAVAGISMGGQAALRLGFKHAEQFPVVAGIASAIDYQILFDEIPELPLLYRSREHCRQDTATLHVRQNAVPRHIWFACDPQDADWYPGNDRLHEKLRAVGVPHVSDLETSHGGHNWDYFNSQAKPMLAFVMAALEKESRRLL